MVKVRVRREDQATYRDRNRDISMNVLGVCNPNMEFIYCLSGWEGSAHDGRVFQDALSRPNGLKVPTAGYEQHNLYRITPLSFLKFH
ncbi:hypothetical protein LINGRAPRIM_LOCUS2359 [Linum grandiflorum]